MSERETIQANLARHDFTQYGSEWTGTVWHAWARKTHERAYKEAFDTIEMAAWRDVLKQVEEI